MSDSGRSATRQGSGSTGLPAPNNRRKRSRLQAWQTLLAAVVAGVFAVVAAVVTQQSSQPSSSGSGSPQTSSASSPQTSSASSSQTSSTSNSPIAIRGVKVSRVGAKTVYAVDGTHDDLESNTQIRVIGKREDGGWEVSPPASVGATTRQVELTTRYSKAMTLRAALVSVVQFSCAPGADCSDPQRETLRQDGWESYSVRDLSPEVTARPG